MKNKLFALSFIIILILFTGCSDSSQKIHKWDNSKYADYSSSVGINVYNEHSFNTKDREDLNCYKANSTLYITDLSKPITVMFNNNGKDRTFVMNVYYDYKPIQFKIDKNGNYDELHTFDLNDGYEIELPLYLPQDLTMSGAHKLLITFGIGPEIHAKDLNQIIDWYGSATIQDIVFNPENDEFDNSGKYETPKGSIPLSYNYALNQDYDYSILTTEIMPNPPITLTVKPNEKFKLIYNVSIQEEHTDQVLLLTTIGFRHTLMNDSDYMLLEIPYKSTGSGPVELTAPDKEGLYEIISYQVCSPFEKISGRNILKYDVGWNQRFTLEVKK